MRKTHSQRVLVFTIVAPATTFGSVVGESNTIVNIGSIVQLHRNLNIKPYKPAIGFNGSRPTTVSCSPVHIKCRFLLAVA